jgi:hypothetical protein
VDTVRVSFSALLRVANNDRYVLFQSALRPSSFEPPGGVYKFFHPAAAILDAVGFQAERHETTVSDTSADLRGFIPARSVRRFTAWFDSEAYREDPTECLRRELCEELEDVALPDLTHRVPRLTFRYVRTVVEGPDRCAGRPYRQLRRFDIFDLSSHDRRSGGLRAQLLQAAADPAVPSVLTAGTDEIRHGRAGVALLAPQSAFLFGSTRHHPDIPPVR